MQLVFTRLVKLTESILTVYWKPSAQGILQISTKLYNHCSLSFSLSLFLSLSLCFSLFLSFFCGTPTFVCFVFTPIDSFPLRPSPHISSRIAIGYARALPKRFRRVLEFLVLVKAFVVLFMLFYIHYIFARNPVNCLMDIKVLVNVYLGLFFWRHRPQNCSQTHRSACLRMFGRAMACSEWKSSRMSRKDTTSPIAIAKSTEKTWSRSCCRLVSACCCILREVIIFHVHFQFHGVFYIPRLQPKTKGKNVTRKVEEAIDEVFNEIHEKVGWLHWVTYFFLDCSYFSVDLLLCSS